MNSEIVFTFASAHYAIQAENILLKASLPVKVMPLPGAIRAGCGLCLRLPLPKAGTAQRLLKEQRVSIQQAYRKTVEKEETIFTIWEEFDNE